VIEIVRSVFSEFWTVLAEMSPYLLFGFFVAGLLSVLLSPETVERHLGGKGILPVAKSALFGVPLPLCSCGVIPVAASLRRHGASRGATTAFLLSTPQTGVDSIFVTFSLLGLTFAVFRPIAAFVTGLVGGWLVVLLVSNGQTHDQPAAGSGDTWCTTDSKRNKLLRFLNYGFVDLPRDIGRALLIGLVIAGIISAAIPPRYFEGFTGIGIWPKIVMMLVGIPIYVCATGSVPIAAALVAKGISPGAALVFLMTGPATNAATIAIVWKTMGRRTAIIYLATVASCALASGMLLDYIFAVRLETVVHHVHVMIPSFINTACAVLLLGVLAHALLWPTPKPVVAVPPGGAMETTTLQIGGMTCSHCAQTVQRALSECAGVTSALVDLRSGTAVLGGKDLDIASLCRAVESVGYTATLADSHTG